VEDCKWWLLHWLGFIGTAAKAQFARQEVIAFESAMMPPEDFLASKKGTTVTLAGVMGFSHGGPAALYSSMVRFQQMHGKPDVQFAAHIPVYGSCDVRLIEYADAYTTCLTVPAYVSRLSCRRPSQAEIAGLRSRTVVLLSTRRPNNLSH
jgi:hypothetical protein